MPGPSIEKIEIFHSTIVMEFEHKEYSMKDLVNYYGPPIQILFKEHFPNSFELTGEVFAKTGFVELGYDKINFDSDEIIFESEAVFIGLLLKRITVSNLKFNIKVIKDFDYLGDLFFSILGNPEMYMYLTRRKMPSNFRGLISQITREFQIFSKKYVQELLIRLKTQIDKIPVNEYISIQRSIYKEALLQFEKLTIDNAGI